MDFANRLIAARKAKELSQEDLAEALGLSRQAVSKWETGESKPDLDNLIGLCKQLELSMEYLCFGAAPKAETSDQIPKRRPFKRIIGIAVTTLCAILVFFLGMHLGEKNAESFSVDFTEDHSALIESIEITDATVSFEDEVILRILPSSAPNGLMMDLLIDNENFPNSKIIPCQFDGLQFSAVLQDTLPRTGYRICAVFTLGDAKKTLPLMHLEFDTVYKTYQIVRWY